MRLPPEIIHSILGSLANDPQGPNIDALKACNLASSTFSAICEPFLYSCIYIYINKGTCKQPDQYDPQCRMSVNHLLGTLAVKPHISRHVKRLGLLILPQTIDDESEPLVDWFRAVDKAVAQLPLHQLEWFRFYSTELYIIGCIKIQRALLIKIISSSALKTLRLNGVLNFPLCEAIPPRHNIRHLDLGPTFTFAENTTENWDDKILTLDSLIARPYTPNMSKLLQLKSRAGMDVVNLTSLSRLRIPDSDELELESSRIIFERCPKLEDLEIVCTYNTGTQTNDSSNWIWGVLESVQKTLRTLEFTLDRWPPSSYKICRDELANLFRLPPEFCFPSLTSLHLELLIIGGPENLVVDANVYEDGDLNDLAEYIGDQKAFPSLQKVQISLTCKQRQGCWALDSSSFKL